MDDIATIFQALEGRLLLKEKYLLLLVDDFQCVYSFLRGTGVPIVQEIAFISDSDLGCTHVVVSGSCKLCKLAFAKLKKSDVGDRSPYESYMSQNLNSTKLQPHWIVPITKPEDFRGLLRMKMPSLTEEVDIVRHFICSGGRPGMLRMRSDLDSSSGLPQSMSNSFSAKDLATGNDIRTKILSCILQCSITKDRNCEARSVSLYQNEDDENWHPLRGKDLERLCSLLALVPVSVIRKSLDATIDDKEFGEALYDLADVGHILFNEDNQAIERVAIADPYLLLELNFKPKK